MNVKIGKHIKALRKRYDVTQESLAEALGVTSQAVSKWENEMGYPDIEYIVAIANFFNVTIDELFGHNKAEKERKIQEYCKKYDEMYRNWEAEGDRVKLMRQALAEYPGEEKLLVRLATALWYKWCNEDFDKYSLIDGKYQHDVSKYRASEGWKEPAKIMDELLATSVDDEIRSQCRHILIRLYGQIGEKEKAYKLAEYCPDCKAANLFSAFNGIYEDESRVHSQRLLQSGLYYLRVHLMRQTKDMSLKAKAIEKLIDLHKFIFDDGNYEFYHARMELLYLDYAEILLHQRRIDEVFLMLEKAYEHAKKFDIYLDEIRKNGEVCYTSTFTNALKDVSDDVYATKSLPQLLNFTLLDESDIYYKTLCCDPRFDDLIERIRDDIGENCQ